MAIKTFTTGEVLTAADTNTYLANAMTVYIGGSNFVNQASVTYDNVFSSTYNQYKFVWHINSTGTTSTDLRAQLTISGTPTATNYVAGMRSFDANLNNTLIQYGQSITTAFLFGNPGEPNYPAGQGEAWLSHPFSSTQRKSFGGVASGLASGVAYVVNWFGGALLNTSAHDGIKIFAGTNNITGSFAIYGVRYP